MLRTIEHTAFVRRNFADVAWLLERHGDEILAHVAGAAVARSAEIQEAADDAVLGFDRGHPISLNAGPLDVGPQHAVLEFTWEGNAAKRLLVNTAIRLDIRPLVRRGPGATTEICLRATYQPPTAHRRSPETVLFGRRVVKAALRELLDVLVRLLEEYEESPLSR
ncbi:MAG: hypothetical protein R2707_17920 [Acidimicrobiales bacterium]